MYAVPSQMAEYAVVLQDPGDPLHETAEPFGHVTVA
jgi:hypothetical protein